MGAKIPASAGAAGLVLDAGQHRAGELVGDRVHVQLVAAAAVEEQRVAAAADEPEARLLVGDVAQAQGVKGGRGRLEAAALPQHVVDPGALCPGVVGPAADETVANLGAVDPRRVGRGEVAAQQPEGDPLARDEVLAHR
jgi:hypothetical protein